MWRKVWVMSHFLVHQVHLGTRDTCYCQVKLPGSGGYHAISMVPQDWVLLATLCHIPNPAATN